MEMKSKFLGFIVGLGVTLNAYSLEYVNLSRAFTPQPFIPSMMMFSVEYMKERDDFRLNQFEFYNTYVVTVRRFVVDPGALSSYKRENKSCPASKAQRVIKKDLIECGQLVAYEYLREFRLTPKFFGFDEVEVEVELSPFKGMWYFKYLGSNVLLHPKSGFNPVAGKPYKLLLNISSKGDYDLKGRPMQFDYEAYLIESRGVRPRFPLRQGRSTTG